MKPLSILILYSFSLSLFADMGTHWPTKNETLKAPPWPSEYQNSSENCAKISTAKFIKQQKEHFISEQIDLNMDGICEVIATAPKLCGNKWCVYFAYQLENDSFKNIGEIGLGKYLEPYNGWLQIKTSTYTGTSYAYHLYRYENGEYRLVRSDYFKEVWKNNKSQTVYLKTEYR